MVYLPKIGYAGLVGSTKVETANATQGKIERDRGKGRENMALSRHCGLTLLLMLAAAAPYHALAFVAITPTRTITPRAAKLVPAQSIRSSRIAARNSHSNTDNNRGGASFLLFNGRNGRGRATGLPGMAVAVRSAAAGWGAVGAGGGTVRRRFQMSPLRMSTLEVTEGAIDGGDGGSGVVEGTVGDDFDVKTNLLNQIDLASSSKKR